MNVALIISLSGGGAERQLIELYEQGVFDKILTLESDCEYDLVPHSVVKMTELTKDSWIILKILYLPVYLIKLSVWCRRHGVKSITSFLARANIVNIFLNVLYMHTTIITERTNPMKSFESGFKRSQLKLIQALYSKADRVVVNSYALKSMYTTFFSMETRKIMVIQNGCNIKKIRSSFQDEISPNTNELRPLCICIGRFVKAKGHSELIDVFELVLKQRPDAHLVLVGAGPLEDQIKDKVTRKNLNQSIHFEGFNKTPFQLMYSADLMVVASHWEGFPNVILEAMACGTPVVSTNCETGPKEILAQSDACFEQDAQFTDCGVLVPCLNSKKNIETMSQAIVKCLNNKAILDKYSAEGLKRIEDFNIEHIKNKWVSLFGSMCR